MKFTSRSPGKAFSDGYAKGRDDERNRNAETIAKLKAALTKAMEENIQLRSATR